MSSHISVRVHYVWSTKHRKPVIGREWQSRLYSYIGGTLAKKNAKLLAAGGIADHIHLYVSLPGTLTIAQAVNLIKSNSSGWVHREFGLLQSFAWQSGYGAFGVSKSVEAELLAYICNQETHHRTMTFEEEYRALLTKHEVDFDERYFLD